MSIRVKEAGVWRTVIQPWIKIDNVQKRMVKVYSKVAGEWREAWPLQPGPVSNVVISTTYRNDRIEIDVDWDAPTTGEVAARYFITVAGGGYSTTVQVNAPATALTLTNGGNGFHTYAGWGMVATVYAQSAAGRNGDSVTSPAVTVAQLPAPPQPTSYSVSVAACAMSHSWAHAGGRRIDGVEIQTQFNHVATTPKKYAASVTSASYQSWDPGTIGGGYAAGYCRTYGPGGVSAWLGVGGTMPNPVTLGTAVHLDVNNYANGSFRYGDGYLRVGTTGISPQVQVHTVPYPYDGNWYWRNNANFAAGAAECYDPQSVNYPRDWYPWGMLLRPWNNVNGWTGRDQWLGWCRKMPSPVTISCNDSQTWRGAGWRSEQDQDWQGSSVSGQNEAFFFYGEQFYDWLGPQHLGYYLDASSAWVVLWRENAGGYGHAVSPRLMIHRSAAGGGDLSYDGWYDTTALARGAVAWCPFPWEWAWYMSLRHTGYRGLGLFHSNTQLLSSIGNVSAEYMIMKASHAATVENGTLWLDSVRIYHRN